MEYYYLPAKAGIQQLKLVPLWIPAFAGMTTKAISNLKKLIRKNLLSNLDMYDIRIKLDSNEHVEVE